MTRLLGLIVIALTLTVPARPAQAQLARTFVSSVSGNDLNDCNRLTPCRTFQRAHDNTLANGEITVLDAGGYGAVTINKTISIINDGVGEAGTLVSGGLNGITITAGASDTVSLRGLTIKGIGFGGGNGIVFNSGKSLTIENCAIRNLTGAFPTGLGILFRPDAPANLAVSNTVVADNGDDGISLVSDIGAAMTAVFSRVELYNNGGDGMVLRAPVTATVVDSVAANNGNVGFWIFNNLLGSGSTGHLMLARSVTANNAIGLRASAAGGAGATIRLMQSTVTRNGQG